MPLALKDVRLALPEAEKAGAPMPSVSLVRDPMITAIARGHARLGPRSGLWLWKKPVCELTEPVSCSLDIVRAGCDSEVVATMPAIEHLAANGTRCGQFTQRLVCPTPKSSVSALGSAVLNGREKTFTWDRAGHDALHSRKP
jgi:hypothetical protein